MKKHQSVRHFFLWAIVILATIQLQAQKITSSEKAIIKSGKDTEVMRVTQITNQEDLRILRALSADIPTSGKRFWKKLSKRMLATVQHPDQQGVGIAAPQVGINRKLILVQRFDKEGEPFESMLNPQIIATGDSLHARIEGCLSIPYTRDTVLRHWEIVVKYQNLRMQWHEEKLEGFTARIFQHELDHLNGILFTDLIRND